MFIGLLQLRHSLQDHQRLYLFSVFVVLTWVIWAIKVGLSRLYRPWLPAFDVTTSVVIPVVDEPADLFREVLQRIVDQHPTETIVVINGPRNLVLEAICEEFAGQVTWTWTPIAGKRNGVKVGVERSIGDITVLVDSDTVWTEGTLAELRKPFADPTIGGVTTRQRILEPSRSFLTRWADWLENSRALYSMPAQSVLGTVGCLPGRTIAFRRVILRKAMHEFMTGKFLGVFLEVSDDRTLTNLTLKQGYRTVYQSTSVVFTDAPTRLKKLVKQQYRWARGSQYNTMRMLPWMLGHSRMLAFFFVMDILMPFLWLCSVISWFVRSQRHDSDNLYAGILGSSHHRHALLAIVLLTVLTSTMAMSLRQARHLHEVPGDVFLMPFFILFSTVVLMPIRIYGFMRLGHVGGWGTRAHAFSGTTRLTDAEREPVGMFEASGDMTDSGGAAVSIAAHTAHVGAADPAGSETAAMDGDPRGLLPYLIAVVIVMLGVAYDVLPV